MHYWSLEYSVKLNFGMCLWRLGQRPMTGLISYTDAQLAKHQFARKVYDAINPRILTKCIRNVMKVKTNSTETLKMPLSIVCYWIAVVCFRWSGVRSRTRSTEWCLTLRRRGTSWGWRGTSRSRSRRAASTSRGWAATWGRATPGPTSSRYSSRCTTRRWVVLFTLFSHSAIRTLHNAHCCPTLHNTLEVRSITYTYQRRDARQRFTTRLWVWDFLYPFSVHKCQRKHFKMYLRCPTL